MYEVEKAVLILAISEMNITDFKRSYDDIKSSKDMEGSNDNVVDMVYNELKRGLEDLEDVANDKKIEFIKGCINYMDFAKDEKEYYTHLLTFSMNSFTLEEKEKIVSLIRFSAPKKHKREAIMYELILANSKRDLPRIKKLLQEINEIN